ncbi:elongation factor-like GTPase 1 isoform X1 [Hydra vulgaris]|uniref:elongation factor-like GTPase 1 isoform X1 n=1 Tax=Hydra vulgaris TaxID=6087 RepID=UPI001F5F78F6|nr:elongation factor-like GTPase 1 isoform X1 [Hydra vulgaris]
MGPDTLEFIAALQKNTKNIRNICILAHVDHGKTTLADCLIASNGIISPKLAGKLRYMDSREDEQQRGITMKSSAISLAYNTNKQNYLVNLIDSPGHVDFSSEVSTAIRLCDGALIVIDVVEGVCPQTQAVLRQAWLEGIKPCLVINKIDRLITEVKLSPMEAYLQLQKVVEQVNAVMGSLFSTSVMEQSNVKINTENSSTKVNADGELSFDWSSGLEDADDENLYFSPAAGNVVFASAIDGWAFGIDTFAEIYSKKLGASYNVLSKTLWGDYYINIKAKKIAIGALSKGKKPLFVQFILENLWNIYDAVILNRDTDRISKIVTNLNLKVSTRDSKTNNLQSHLQAILYQWLPLSEAVLKMVSSSMPSPLDISEERVKTLMCGRYKTIDIYSQDTQKLKDVIIKCGSEPESPVIVFVSKMLSVLQSDLPKNRKKPLEELDVASRYEAAKKKLADREMAAECAGDEFKESKVSVEVEENDQCFIAFARVFSGVLKKGSKLFVLGPKYSPLIRAETLTDSPLKPVEEVVFGHKFSSVYMAECTIGDLYLLMGKELNILDAVPAGNILGINGCADYILKSATLSSTLACPAFTPIPLEAKPIVRVAVEPRQPSQLHRLVGGMKLLNQADPCVEVLVQETGEYVIVAAGEVHLQRCLDDLTQRFAKIQIKSSEPIVPFRETIVIPPKVDMVNEQISGTNKNAKHHTQRLPSYMLKEIQSFSDTIRKQEKSDINIKLQRYEEENSETFYMKDEIVALRKEAKKREKLGLIEAFTADKQYCVCVHAKPLPLNVLKCLEQHNFLLKIIQRIYNEDDFQVAINSLSIETKLQIRQFYDQLREEFQRSGKLWKDIINRIWAIGPKGVNDNILINNVNDYTRPSIWCGFIDELKNEGLHLREFDNSVISGFQLAVQAGPICEEPMMGVAFFIEDWKRLGNNENSYVENSLSYGPISGQHISALKAGCRRAFMAQHLRLMAAMYSCDIQTTSDVLGKLYGVLGKREGKILKENMKEGSDVFDIVAQLPVAESFGFAEEIRKKTSGLASPQLIFSHWELLDIDPFWIPTTDEEYELYGEKADSENQALKYVNQIRKRKGLYVDEKTVEHAEKQRTLKKNK